MSEKIHDPAPESIEATKEFSSKIDLHFFRHDEKEKAPEKNDYTIELTPAGREHAVSQSDEKTNLAQ